MSDAVIQAGDIAKTYRTGEVSLKVLESLNLSIDAGEFVSIQGESGCGKTTLLNVLAGIESPDSGYVKWGGQSISTLGRNELARRRGAFLGIVFQSYYLVPEIDTLQNVLMSRRIVNGGLSTEDVEDAKTLLGKVGLGDRCHQLPGTLSGGEKQRVAIARALLTNPKLVLADEPTGNLDEATGEVVMDLLQGLCGETQTALVLVTHNPDHASRANRKLTLSHGQIH
ncbi:ABC transporter ATP-binding protein [Pelagicoccus mobilis]|uniref:ABC transporter ATP-binding protein n=1 Tax=Pelagicoccus mobilis TaxID=415221 RepID=A0A934RVB8_9BACT|nr:ABC transporter ATP-binding protein [Pelagicoccus mobilis]MBK1877136.1 ABC transporter ATP-binding protein [Pelagicoccus mobilis]